MVVVGLLGWMGRGATGIVRGLGEMGRICVFCLIWFGGGWW